MKVSKKAIAQPKFLYGFEIEGAYKYGDRKALRSLLRSVYKKDIPCCIDHSLDHFGWSHTPIEIKTPPLPEQEALLKLIEVFQKLEKYNFKTNSTCGLHVNISERGIFKQKLRNNRELQEFCCKFANNFNVDKWLGSFKRKGNIYCRWGGIKNRFQSPESVANFLVKEMNLKEKKS